MSELKPCPFCGQKPYFHVEDGVKYVSCINSGCIADASWHEPLAGSETDWNTRPIEDALQAENERLKEDLQHEKTRSQLNLEAEERRMLNITYYCAEIDRLNARIAELESAQRWIPVSERLPEAERKEFCPNCEAETPCTHEAELFVCDICGEDFAKYIVSRSANVSDVSTTQDVLIDIKTPQSIENTNPDYYKHDAVSWISIANGRLPEKFQECIVLDKNNRVHKWIHDDALFPIFAQYTHWMPLPEPPIVYGKVCEE